MSKKTSEITHWSTQFKFSDWIWVRNKGYNIFLQEQSKQACFLKHTSIWFLSAQPWPQRPGHSSFGLLAEHLGFTKQWQTVLKDSPITEQWSVVSALRLSSKLRNSVAACSSTLSLAAWKRKVLMANSDSEPVIWHWTGGPLHTHSPVLQ